MTQSEKKKASLSQLLLTLWWAIWLVLISVFTVFHANAAPATPAPSAGNVWYTWYEDLTEVVNKVNFVQSWEQSQAWEVANIYAKDNTTLAIEINQIVSDNANTLAPWMNSQILWWSWITIWSENITIIWWGGNTVVWNNDNATVLWWLWNEIQWSWFNAPSVLIGWTENVISESQWGLVIVWWSNNKIVWGWSSSQILWWEGNTLTWTVNAIVAWSGVQASWVNNIFVFSDWYNGGWFSPETSWAFYINTEMWLWLGRDSSGWVASDGWVSVWAIDISDASYACNADNVWVQWVYYYSTNWWCLMWCTTWSAAEWKWDLLETSKACVDWCNNTNWTWDVWDRLCVDTVIAQYTGFDAICNTWSLGDMAWIAEPCSFSNQLLENFRDALFDIDFVDVCPDMSSVWKLANPCVYKCPDWYAGGWLWGWCKAPCTLPWDETQQIRHGSYVTWYMATWTTCATTCNIYKATLQCDNWELKQLWWAPADAYKYESCELSAWPACSSSFDLTSTELVSWWLYSGCVEYRTDWNSACTAINKYMFTWCAAGYTQVWENECSLGCEVPWSTTWWTIPVWASVTWYRNAEISCNVWWENTFCNTWSQQLTCGTDGYLTNISSYPNSWCVVTPVEGSSSWFNLTECPKARAASWTLAAGINEGDAIWYCEINTWYTVEWGQACKIYFRYHLTWCIEWYYKSWDSCLPRCIYPWSTAGLSYNKNSTDQANKDLWEANSIVYGAKVKWYKTTSQQCPTPVGWTNNLKWCEATDNWTMMTCGAWWVLWWRETYKYAKCDSLPVVNKTWFNRTEPVAHAVCEEHQPYSTWGNICVQDHKTYKCTRCDTWYTLNGDITKLTWGDPTALCLEDCTFDISPSGQHTLNWFSGSTWVYNASTYTCPTAYDANTSRETWTCYDWTITRSLWLIPLTWKPYLTYVQRADTCSVVNESTNIKWTRTIEVSGSGNHSIANATAVQNHCVTYRTWTSPNACTPVNTRHYLRCNADTDTSDRDGDNSYVWNSSSTACVRCEWSVPVNWHRNNATFPTSAGSSFHYTTNTSEVCGFSCDDGYYWSGGACVSYYCDLNWTSPKIHNIKITIYKPSANPVCNTECEAISAQCRYGKWMKLNWTTLTSEEVVDPYSSCATRTGYTTSTNSTPTAWTCPQTNNGTTKTLTSRPANTNLLSTCAQYVPSGSLWCNNSANYFTVDCPSATAYWTGNLCQKYCVWSWSNYKQWQTVIWYSNKSPTCSTDCNAVKITKTCQADGTWNNTTYNQTTCATVSSTWSCDSSFNLTSQWDSNWVYSTCTGYTANGQACNSYNKYKLTSCKAWYTLYNGWCYKNCTLDGKTINYRASDTWYTASRNCQYYWGCDSVKQTLTCTWTDKNNTYLATSAWTKVTTSVASCSNSCNDCVWTVWWDVAHLATVTWYSSSSLNCTSTSTKCASITRQCIDGVMQWSSTYNKASCTLNSVDNCAAATSTEKKVLWTTSIANSSKSKSCSDAYSGANPPTNTCTQKTYNYYTCNTNYHWNSWKTACVWDTLNCGWSAPTSNVTKWASTYTYAWSTKSWTETSWTPWACQFKCDTGYSYNWTNCVWNTVNCGWSAPSSNVDKWSSTYVYAWTSKSWTEKTTAWDLWACEYRCKTNYVLNWTSCVGSWMNCGWSAPTHSTKWTATYTWAWTAKSWTYKESWTPWVCEYVCHENYCWTECSWCLLNCGWSAPSSNVEKWSNKYTYAWTTKSWTQITSWTPWACEYKCTGWTSWPNCTSAGCDWPCWSVSNWQSLTCYKASSPTCPSTCSSQTRTCSNGSWNSSFDSSYTASSCTPQAVSCDSSYYPATSTSSNCSSWVDCTEYSVSNKSCVEGSTRYYASQPKAGYYVDHSNSNDDDCYAICNPSSSSCNGGYTPSGTNYSSTYTCTKGSSSSIVGASSTSCSCSYGKVRYNGSCQTVSTTCGSSHYNCIGGNSSANTPISHGYTRTCIGSSTKYCHECNTNYVRDGDSCELDAPDTYTCVAWKYLPANSTSCSNCTAWYYCPGGTREKSSSIQWRNSCPSGYGNSSAWSDDQDDCYMSVSANKYVKNARDSSATSCPSWYSSSAHTVYYWDTSSCTANAVVCPASWACPATQAWYSCKKYALAEVTYPYTCSYVTATCQSNWTWDVTPGRSDTCTQTHPSCTWCPSWTVNHNWTCTSYNRCSSTKITSTCTNGSWNTTPGAYSSANQGCYSCPAKWACSAASHWSTCVTYSQPYPTGSPCSYYQKTSTCDDGTWSPDPGSQSSCGCYSQVCGITQVGGTCSAYSVSVTPAYNVPCSSYYVTATCQSNGSWSVSNFSSMYASCSEPSAPANCTFNGSTVANGSSVTAYLSDKPNGARKSITRTCNNGILWGSSSYSYSSCTPGCDESWACPATADWWTCRSYTKSSAATLAKCNSAKVTSTCSNGSWSPTPGSYDFCDVIEPSCFIAWTQVTMADGSKKNIEDVQIWDKVLWQNTTNTVEEFFRPLLWDQWLYSINGSKNFVSPAHPFMTTEWWKSLNPEESSNMLWIEVWLLEVWDVLIREDWEEKIETLVWISADEDTQLYNFRVSGDNTYYANGYLVHNKISPNACMLCYGYTPGLNEVCCEDASGLNGVSCKSAIYAVSTDYGNSCSCCTTCFPAWTQVTMADWSTKNIEDINTWDVVLSYNTETKSLEPNIASPIVHVDGTDEMYELTINWDILKVTYTHRFYVVLPSEDDYKCSVSYDWVAAKDLAVWDLLFMKDWSYAIINNIDHYPNVETVYNLSVNNNHNYFVDKGYLVHNAKQQATACLEYYCASTESDCESAAVSDWYTCPSRGACCYDRWDGCWCYKS